MSEELFSEMRKLEERGREIAYHRAEINSVERARSWIWDLMFIYSKIMTGFKKFANIIEDINQYIEQLRMASIYLDRDLSECEARGIDRLKDCKITDYTVNEMMKLDRKCKSLVGERCIYLSFEPTTASAAINDLTACFHRLIEYLEKETRKERIEEEGDKYVIMKGAGERERKLLKIWLESIEKLKERGLYEEIDWDVLSGAALRGKLELKIGSRAGHRTHVDVEKNELRYYDRDIYVNREIDELLERYAGCSCRIYDDGVICRRCNLERAVKVIAGATSCYPRLSELERRGLNIEEAIEEDIRRIVEALEL